MRFQQLQTVDVFRKGQGRRYSALPVDTLDRDMFVIDCADGPLRPDIFDLQPGDTVRFLQGERYVQATITTVQRNGHLLSAHLADAELLPPDYFPF
jgi:hypothetical protein